MSNAVKKAISLPADIARQAEKMARAEGKTLSGVIQDALRFVEFSVMYPDLIVL